jgi:hypothetical protein
MEQNRKRILKGIVIILIGITVLDYRLSPLFYLLGHPFNIGRLHLLAFWILGIAFILTGTFTLVQWKSRTGKIVLGLISTTIGGILVLLTSLIISSSLFLNWGDPPILATFLISGTVLFLHGLFLIIKKQKNMKVLLSIIFISIGVTVIIWMSPLIYELFTAPILVPFFAIALYLDLIIVGIASLIICYFIIKPIKKGKIKLLMGRISIIIGGVIIIIALFGIINFYTYAGVVN